MSIFAAARKACVGALLLAFIASTPSSVTRIGRLPDGTIITPIGQRLRPWGRRVEFDGRPNSIALSPDGRLLAIANITSLDLLNLRTNQRQSYAYVGFRGHTGTGESPQGLAFSPNGTTVYVATQRTMIQRFNVGARVWMAPFVFSGLTYKSGSQPVGSLPAGLALSSDGQRLYAALDAENKLVAQDAFSGRVIGSRMLGIAPVGVFRSGDSLAVLNWGGPIPQRGDTVRPSGSTRQPVAVDASSGIAARGSVSILSLPDLKVRHTVITGRHPFAAVFLTPSLLAVAQANADSVAVIDTSRGIIVSQTRMTLPGDHGWGLEPQALALSPDHRKLFVGLAGANAVARYRITPAHRLIFEGAFPTDWYPGALAALPDGGLAVANLKGIGSLANVSNDSPAGDDMPVCGARDGNGPTGLPGGHDAHMFRGSIGIVNPKELSAIGTGSTSRTVALSRQESSANAGAAFPHLRHVFFIVRENRSYDQVFGDLPQGNGDSRLTNFPRRITPNAHSLAEQYILLDNFYSSGTQSGDGHQWIVESATTDYIERSFPAWARSYPKSGDDPLAYAGSGFIWENALRHGLTVRDYGEFAVDRVLPRSAVWSDFWKSRGSHAAARASVYAHSEIPDLDPYVDHRFGGFDLRIPDQLRADEFTADLSRYERAGRVPNLVLMLLGDDHTSGFDPKFPQPCSMVADNDLALGRIVQYISHSSFWKDSLILVTEDDSQDGLDHVDGHRQVALMIGPYVRRHAVDSHMYNQLSFIRTLEAVLGLPPMNRFDSSSAIMSDAFVHNPDFTPYDVRAENVALGRMNLATSELRGERRRLAEEMIGVPPDVPDAVSPAVMQRVLWLGPQPARLDAP